MLGKGNSKFTQKLFDTICERLSNSMDGLNHICKEHNITAPTFRAWIREGEEEDKTRATKNKRHLLSKYVCAKEDQADYMAEQILVIAQDKRKRKKGKNSINHYRADQMEIDALKWTASKLKPKTWGDKIDITTGGEMLPEPRVFNVTPNEQTKKNK